jgi:hypothetical protein
MVLQMTQDRPGDFGYEKKFVWEFSDRYPVAFACRYLRARRERPRDATAESQQRRENRDKEPPQKRSAISLMDALRTKKHRAIPRNAVALLRRRPKNFKRAELNCNCKFLPQEQDGRLPTRLGSGIVVATARSDLSFRGKIRWRVLVVKVRRAGGDELVAVHDQNAWQA